MSDEVITQETPDPVMKIHQTVVPINSKLVNHNPVQLAWKNLQYKVKPTGLIAKCKKVPEKQILYPMSGYVNPGQVLAVMGPSGSGKTSLLNILANRVDKSGGEITLNGSPMSKRFKSISAYVQQDDILNGNLTVYEALLFTALLRVSGTLTEKRKRVNDVLEELGLVHCKNTKIGIPGISKGISGGERKRVSIGVELLTSPSVLFLDEPTSGLDAKTALSLMDTILRLAKQNRTIVCTIHQPRSDIYKKFDKLLLLAEGKVAYFGEANGTVKHFEQQGIPMPKNYNPADFFIDVVTKETNQSTEELQTKRKEDIERIKKVLDYNEKTLVVEIPNSPSDFDFEKQKIQKYSTWWINEFIVLFIRCTINNLRDRVLTVARIFQVISMSLLVGLIFLQTKRNQAGIQNRIGSLFFILINQAMLTLFGGLQVFHLEKVVFLRERGSKTFRVSSYYLAKTLAEIPTSIVFPFIFSTISYWMVGFRAEAGAFFTYSLINIILANTAQALGLVLSASTPNQNITLAIAPLLTTFLMLFGGFYVNSANIPPWFIWIHYISLFKYAYEALIVNEFQNLPFYCDPGETIPPYNICPVTNGNQVLKSLSMNNVNLWIDVACLFAIFIALRIIGYLVIRFYQRPKVQR